MGSMNNSFITGLSSFFNGLLPVFEKTRLLDDLDSSMEELKITQEMYSGITPNYIAQAKRLYSNIDKELDNKLPSYNGDILGTVKAAIDMALSEKDALVDLAKDSYSDTIMKDVLDYLKLNIIRYVEGFRHFNRFARALILDVNNAMLDNPESYGAVDREYKARLDDRVEIKSFIAMVYVMRIPVKDIRDSFAKVKGVTFNPETDVEVRKHVGHDKADPLKMGMVPILGGFVYRLGKAFNEYLSYRQDLAKEELEKNRIQLILMRRKADESSTPQEREKLEKQIAYYNNRINKLQAKLEDMEEGD